MDIAKQIIQSDLEYTAWANRRALAACSDLSETERIRDLGQSHRSVLGTLHHIYEGERFWSDCLIANELPPMDQIGGPDEPPAVRLEDLTRAWPDVWAALLSWLAALPEGALTLTLPCRLSAQRTFDFNRWQLLRHLVNHSTLHRGQVVGMLRDMGKQPTNVDLLTYYVRKD